MRKRKKSNNQLRREEEAISAAFTYKLHALFQTRYREYKRNNYKSKDKGGDKKDNHACKIKKTSVKSLKNIKSELEILLAFYGVGTPHIAPPNQTPLSREQICMMDIDFEGLYITPNQEGLSGPYRQAKENSLKYDIPHTASSSEYDLNQVPAWEEMKKFNSFRLMHHTICHRLSKMNYPIEKLNQLNFIDLIDIINDHNREHPEHRMPCQRSRFLKMFSVCYGAEFTEKMTLLGKDQEAKDFLSYAYYINHPAKRCPPELKYISNLFSIHHIKNRKFANELDDYAKVNDFSNLSLCMSFPHHKILHSPTEIDLNHNIVFFGGFLREFQIIRNPEKERLYLQGKLRNPSLSNGGR